MIVEMSVTPRFFLEVKNAIIEMSGYYSRHYKLVTPEPGLPEWVNRVDGQVRAGLHEHDGAEKCLYVRSSGSWLELAPENLEIVFSGRRHSLKDILSGINDPPEWGITSWQYYDTQASYLAPWETTT